MLTIDIASYDIAKDGDMVAVLTLIKTTYRLGESVLGVVTFNQPSYERRVLKVGLHPNDMIPVLSDVLVLRIP